MRQLMGEELLPGIGLRAILIGSEHDMMSYRECERLNGAGGFSGKSVGMDSHVPEITTEPQFHERARVGVQRTSLLLQRAVDDWGGRETAAVVWC
jgi:hypothetical protein